MVMAAQRIIGLLQDEDGRDMGTVQLSVDTVEAMLPGLGVPVRLVGYRQTPRGQQPVYRVQPSVRQMPRATCGRCSITGLSHYFTCRKLGRVVCPACHAQLAET